MDQLVSTIVTQLPNFAIAIWVIWNYQTTIKNLLDNQQKLLDQLMQAKGLKVETAQIDEPPGAKQINPS